MLKNNTLLLLDGNALMHRAYHGVNKNFLPIWNKMPVGMVYGFASTVINILGYFNPKLFITTFDTKEKTFRHKLDENYKAHREKAPDDFYPQIPLIFELLETLNLPSLKLAGFESDDLIGTLANKAHKSFEKILIVSGDLDFTQLVDDKIKLVKFNGKIEDSIVYGAKEVLARYGVKNSQMVDFKAICGDSSDNYKGIEGIGLKGAEKLLNEFGSLENILNNLEKLDPKIREKFIKQKDYVLHCQTLAKIHTAVPIEFDFAEKLEINEEGFLQFLEKMGFRALITRFMKMQQSLQNPKKEILKKIDNQMNLF